MIFAYDKKYVYDAMRCLGEAMDYSVHCCNTSMDIFLELFIGSGYAEQFAAGVPKIVSGLSGTELVMSVFEKSGIQREYLDAQVEYDYSVEYWCGWIVAYYQWHTGVSFKEIHKNISMHEIEMLYSTLHEASEEKFVDVVNRRIRLKNSKSRLQEKRKNAGYSQRELAEKAQINIRTLQQYESKAKDINKAAGATLLALSIVLGCQIEDILEYDYSEIEENSCF